MGFFPHWVVVVVTAPVPLWWVVIWYIIGDLLEGRVFLKIRRKGQQWVFMENTNNNLRAVIFGLTEQQLRDGQLLTVTVPPHPELLPKPKKEPKPAPIPPEDNPQWTDYTKEN